MGQDFSFFSLSLSLAAFDTRSPILKGASSDLFLKLFHLTIPHMCDSEVLCSLILSRAFLHRLTPSDIHVLWLVFFSSLKKRRQLKQNMASRLGEYSSHVLFLYNFFSNDHPSSFFGKDESAG